LLPHLTVLRERKIDPKYVTAAFFAFFGCRNDQPEDPSAMQRPNETQQAYFARLQKEQGERLAKGLTAITGN
jgi:hypothetical protein